MLILLFFAVFLPSCVKQPAEPPETDGNISGSAALILCEGLWGMNNSSLSAFEISNAKLMNNYFLNANNSPLGDIANDIILKGDTAFIAVSESGIIEAVNIKTGRSLGRIDFGGNSYPRKIYIASDTLAFVSDLYNHCLRTFNPKTYEAFDRKIETGPAPEGIDGSGSYVFAVNSGYGDYLSNIPKAGTISVIDKKILAEVKIIPAAPNPVEILVNTINSRIYCTFRHLPSQPDSLGGIIEYSLNDLKETRRWRFDAEKAVISPDGKYLYAANISGVYKINLQKEESKPELIIKNSNKNENWYCAAVSPFDGSLWIGNALNYQSSGKVSVYSHTNYNSPLIQFKTGVNPSKIIFFAP